MITIYCALHPEAQKFIQHYKLKKESAKRHFQVFSNEEKALRLVITGVGAVNAAVAVAEISTAYPPQKEDILVNFGSSAADAGTETGSVCLCNKLTEDASGRTFYPDILYRHSFAEAALFSLAAQKTLGQDNVESEHTAHENITHESVAYQGNLHESTPHDNIAHQDPMYETRRLYDMEGAAVYQSGNFYYGPHQMIFIKTVTDYGVPLAQNGRHMTEPGAAGAAEDGEAVHNVAFRQQFAAYMEQAVAQVIPYIDDLRKISAQQVAQTAMQRQKEQLLAQETERLAADLHCSVTMRAELAQQLRYWQLAHVDYETAVGTYYAQGVLPCRDKRMGRKILDELKNQYL